MNHDHPEFLTVSAGVISRNFGLWQDKAFSQPVIITNHGRPRTVLVSADRFAELGLSDHAATAGRQDISEASLSAVLEHTVQPFVAVDELFNISYSNHLFEDVTGIPSSRLAGARIVNMFPLAYRAIIDEQLHRVFRSGETVDLEVELNPQNHEDVRIFLLRAFPFPTGVGILLQNVTERRANQLRVRQSIAFDQALDALSVLGVIKLNVRGLIVEADEPFSRITGFGADDLVKCRLSDIVVPSQRHPLMQQMEDVLSGRPARLIRTTLLVKGGEERQVEIGLAPVMHGLTPDGAIAAIKPLG